MPPKVKNQNELLLKTIRDRFTFTAEAEKDIRTAALDDLKFRTGDQWPDEMKMLRGDRPVVTINRIPQFIRQVTNQQRQMKSAIVVSPSDNEATVEVANVLQSLIRNIEQESNAQEAYNTALNFAAGSSFGYIRVISQFVKGTMLQDLRIKRVKNPFLVYMDPSCQEADRSDANYAFVMTEYEKEAFKQEYPNAELSKMPDWRTLGDAVPGWVTDHGCRVVEYYVRERSNYKLVQLSDGSCVRKDSIAVDIDGSFLLPGGLSIVQEREDFEHVIKWYKSNGIEILSETIWPGEHIPIVPVLGDEIDINGKTVIESVTRYAKDPQRMFNYWAATETEAIASTPRAPFIGYEGQFEGREQIWGTANAKNYGYLEVKAIVKNGQVLPLPQRNNFEPAIAAISTARAQAVDDMKATTGIYDASLGGRSNENSAKAIVARDNQSDQGTYHYGDNLNNSIRTIGIILLEAIPYYYDTPRIVRIVGDNDEATMVAINQITMEGDVQKEYNLTKGKYTVIVKAGTSYASKRVEAVTNMIQLTQSYPPMMQIAGDILLKNMDWDGAAEAAERFKKTLPPELKPQEFITLPDGNRVPKDQVPVPPQVQQMIAQGQKMISDLSDKVHELSHTIETKQVEVESKERIAFAQMRTQMVIAEMNAASKENVSLLNAEIAAIDNRLNLLSVDEPIGDEPTKDDQIDQQGQQPTGGQTPGL